MGWRAGAGVGRAAPGHAHHPGRHLGALPAAHHHHALLPQLHQRPLHVLGGRRAGAAPPASRAWNHALNARVSQPAVLAMCQIPLLLSGDKAHAQDRHVVMCVWCAARAEWGGWACTGAAQLHRLRLLGPQRHHSGRVQPGGAGLHAAGARHTLLADLPPDGSGGRCAPPPRLPHSQPLQLLAGSHAICYAQHAGSSVARSRDVANSASGPCGSPARACTSMLRALMCWTASGISSFSALQAERVNAGLCRVQPDPGWHPLPQ